MEFEAPLKFTGHMHQVFCDTSLLAGVEQLFEITLLLLNESGLKMHSVQRKVFKIPTLIGVECQVLL